MALDKAVMPVLLATQFAQMVSQVEESVATQPRLLLVLKLRQQVSGIFWSTELFISYGAMRNLKEEDGPQCSEERMGQ